MTELVWLSEPESRAWRGYLALRLVLDRGVDRQLTQESGISVADYQLLVPLSEAPGGAMRARDLGRVIDWERSRLSHQIRRMEQRGLIERSECPTDARGTIIVLTRSGRRMIEAAAPSHVEWVRSNFIGLLSPDEVEMLAAISNRVLAHLRESAGACASSADLVDVASDAECPTLTLASPCDAGFEVDSRDAEVEEDLQGSPVDFGDSAERGVG